MAKPLKVTDAMKEELRKEFNEYLENGKLLDGKVSFVRPYEYKHGNGKVRVHFTTQAYLKMTALIDGFSGEVGWYGIVDRPEQDLFVVSDIIVYPQTVGSATVESDQLQDNSEYTKWLCEVPDEVWNKARMQGHSHVNMEPFSSGEDLRHQSEIVRQFNREDHYYIFMIWNKKRKYTVKVYDMVTNTLFEDDDVVVTSEMALDIASFMKEAKELVTVQQYSYNNYSGYNGNYGGNYGGYSGANQYGHLEDDDDQYDGHAGSWHRRIYGDGKKEPAGKNLPAAQNNTGKGKTAEKKDGGAAATGGADKVVDFGHVFA